jgi:hypothetical protein
MKATAIGSIALVLAGVVADPCRAKADELRAELSGTSDSLVSPGKRKSDDSTKHDGPGAVVDTTVSDLTPASQAYADIRREAFTRIDMALGFDSQKLLEERLAAKGVTASGGAGAALTGGTGAAVAGTTRESPIVKVLLMPLLRSLVIGLIDARVGNEALRGLLKRFVGGVSGLFAPEFGGAALLSEEDWKYLQNDQALLRLKNAAIRLRDVADRRNRQELDAEAASQSEEMMLDELELEFQLEKLRAGSAPPR